MEGLGKARENSTGRSHRKQQTGDKLLLSKVSEKDGFKAAEEVETNDRAYPKEPIAQDDRAYSKEPIARDGRANSKESEVPQESLHGSATFSSVVTEDPAELEAQRAALAEVAEEVEDQANKTNTAATLQSDMSETANLSEMEATTTTTKSEKRPQRRRKVEPPKEWSPDAVRISEERRERFQNAAERPGWKPQLHPKEERAGWNQRHQVLYSNARLHPNYRSYFDRCLEFESKPALELMKPSWRLNPDGDDPDERLALQELAKTTGANARPYVDSAGPPPILELEASSSRSFEKDLSAANPVVKPGETTEMPQSEVLAMTTGPTTRWNDRHHVLWCNERNCTGVALNHRNLRSYFDRMRNPGNSRGEASWRGEREAVLDKLERVRPDWFLHIDPFENASASRSSEFLTSGGGGTIGTFDRSTQEELPSPSDPGAARRRNWNGRHHLTFQNQEVSRLDRSYFDRWREAPALLEPVPKDPHHSTTSSMPSINEPTREADGQNKKRPPVRPLKPTWSLDRDGSPDRTARELLKNSAGRHSNHGKWDPRHQRIFVNEIHTNLKNYFDRHRAPEEMAGSRRRKKVKDDEKLKVDTWSLQLYGPIEEHCNFLRSESAPELLQARQTSQKSTRENFQTAGSATKSSATGSKRTEGADNSKTSPTVRKKKERPAWFSSHGIHF